MKFTKILTTAFVALGATLALSGCIRETFPKESAITEGQLMTGETSVILERLLPGIHAGLTATAGAYDHNDYGYFSLGVNHDFECKNCVTNGWMFGINPYYNRFPPADFALGYAPNSLMSAWSWMTYYPTIRSCNYIIHLAGDNEEYAFYRGTAKAYRAMLYLDLARLFEPLYAESKNSGYEDGVFEALGLTVPIIDESYVGDEGEELAKNNPRATREEIFNFIFADLADAEACLDGVAQQKPFYPTAAVVYGLYARAYMWLACEDFVSDGLNGEHPTGNAAYQLAREYARKSLQTSGGAIMTKNEWTNTTTGFNTVASSWMLSLVTSSETVISNLHQHPAHLSPEAIYGYATYTHPGVSKLVYDELNDSDYRKALIKGPETTYAEFKQYTSLDESSFDQFAPYTFFKFRPGNASHTDSTVGGAVALPIMRCEEMYFIEMEATYHIDGDAAARDLLVSFVKNRDSNYVCYKTGEDVLSEIIFQKGFEFWGEGIIMFDMKRLDMGVTCSFDGSNYYNDGQFNSEGRLPWWTYCIPQSELERNAGIDVNNPDPTQGLKPGNSDSSSL